MGKRKVQQHFCRYCLLGESDTIGEALHKDLQVFFLNSSSHVGKVQMDCSSSHVHHLRVVGVSPQLVVELFRPHMYVQH